MANELGVPGSHNVENAPYELLQLRNCVALKIKSSKKCGRFGGVKHRLQYVGEISHVKFYNSKSQIFLQRKKALSGLVITRLF